MADAITVSAPISGTDRTLSFETGKLAGQADGAVLGRIGDTMVLVTATASRKRPRRAPTSSPSPSTSKSGCTPRARSPARSSAGRVAPPTRPS